MPSEYPSGRQYEISYGNQRAIVVEVGAALRTYDVDGKPVVEGFPVESMADGGRGQPLLPWPNRLADGRYEFDGKTHQLPIDEIARNNASHGLTRWLNWTLVSQSTDRVRVEQVLHPRPGYPFTLHLQLEYSLSESGLTVRTFACNVGGGPLPFGAGQHPYFTAGTAQVNEASLQIPAANRLELDSERRLPTGRRIPVEGTEFDFRQPRSIGDMVIDDCFHLLEADGSKFVTLTGQRTVTVWMDQRYRYAQVFSGDTLAPDRRRRGLAIEPMTCPPNAFRSSEDLIVLQPGEEIQLEWGVRV